MPAWTEKTAKIGTKKIVVGWECTLDVPGYPPFQIVVWRTWHFTTQPILFWQQPLQARTPEAAQAEAIETIMSYTWEINKALRTALPTAKESPHGQATDRQTPVSQPDSP